MSRRLMTVAEFCDEIGISHDTFYKWRGKGKTPVIKKLPNGQLRIDRADFDVWMEQLEAA